MYFHFPLVHQSISSQHASEKSEDSQKRTTAGNGKAISHQIDEQTGRLNTAKIIPLPYPFSPIFPKE
jgi:hypothetical protein